MNRPPLRTAPGFEEDPTLKENGGQEQDKPLLTRGPRAGLVCQPPSVRGHKVWKQMNREGIRAARRTVMLTSAHQANVKVAP
uniref:Uncharacterized protein n=1 Tax=Ralstonia solanacearum CFBP2957 TaxID=859656 RepID=D8P385_RALSL|nr:protein of unknown function [Ralstonia solanacearum CFBP2957]